MDCFFCVACHVYGLLLLELLKRCWKREMDGVHLYSDELVVFVCMLGFVTFNGRF